MKVAYNLTIEWSTDDIADAPELVDDTSAAMYSVIGDLAVSVEHVDTDHGAYIWKITGPDVDEAARRLDIDVEDE